MTYRPHAIVSSTLALVLSMLAAGCGGGAGGGGGSAAGGGGAGDGGAGGGDAKPPPSTGSPTDPASARKDLEPALVGPLYIDPTRIELGVVDPQSQHELSFKLENRGQQPVRILQAKPTCACTAPENVAGTTIPPGGTHTFGSGFTAPVESGPKDAEIRLAFESGGQTYQKQLYIAGEVQRPIRAVPPYVEALKGATSGSVRVESEDGEPFSIVSAGGVEPVYVDGFQAGTAPRSSYTIRWVVPQRTINRSMRPEAIASVCEGMRLWWPVVTDRADCRVLPVYIRHECTGFHRDPYNRSRGWYFDEYIGDVGAIKAGTSKDVTVNLRLAQDATAPPQQVTVRSLDPKATASLVTLTANETLGNTRCVVRFTPGADVRGPLYAMVEFATPTGKKDIAFIAEVEP